MPETSLPCSHHIFLYPFTFDCVDDLPIDEGKWQEDEFAITKETTQNYNAWSYFYTATKPSLFGGDEKKLLRRYKYQYLGTTPKPTYTIDVLGEPEPYCLTITQITLTLYSTGVGVLAFHLDNYYYHSPEDILKINDFGRRCYPQFLAHGGSLLNAAQSAFLAKSITLRINLDTFWEDFSAFDGEKLDFKQAYIPTFVKKLLNNDFCSQCKIIPIIDDRMFVICWYGNNERANALKTYYDEYSKTQTTPYLDDPRFRNFWYKYTFIDGNNAGINNIPMQKRLIEESTYERWSDYGTLYGVTRYSFVLLTDRSDMAKDVLFPHIKNMYFQMVQLCLVQRASILKLQTDIAQEATKGNLAAIEKIYKNDLTFINKIFFREISPQEQGIELYKKLHERMEIPAQMKELDAEIQQLHQYSLLVEQKERIRAADKAAIESEKVANAINTLTVFSTIAVLPSFLIGYYGTNVLPDANEWQKKLFLMLLIVICPTLSWFSYKLYDALKKKETRKKIDCRILGLIAMVLIAMILPVFLTIYQPEENTTKIDLKQYEGLLKQDSLLLYHLKHDTTNVRTKK